MKVVAAIASLAGLLAFTSLAQADQVRFRGGMTLTDAQNCRSLFAGDTFTSAFRPANVGDNPNVTSLSHLQEFGADIYELAGGNFLLKRWTRVDAHGLSNEHYEFAAAVKITSQSPDVIKPDTKFVTLTGLIRNAANDPGTGADCVVAFRAAYFRRYEY